jgi:TolA-binding protein
MRSRFALLLLGLLALGGVAADPPKPAGKTESASATDTKEVERVLTARKEYQGALIALYNQYEKSGDKLRAQWVEEELKTFHLMSKPSYRLDLHDVPPASLEAKDNVKAANDLYKEAMKYKDKGTGTEYTLNQRRAEILLQEILAKHPTSDKIADVAYQLGDLYEGKAYRQYERAAEYFQRAYQWRKGTANDSRMRAAIIYDKTLNERSKAVEMYREVVAHDTSQARIQQAEKRLAELLAARK